MQGLKLESFDIKKIASSLSIELILLMFSFLEASFLLTFHRTNLDVLAMATFSPINGHAMVRAFQNRLLSGEIMCLIDSKNIVNSFEIFILVFTFVCNVLVFILFSKQGNKKALIMTFIFILIFLLFQDKNWLYGWDFLDVSMTILVLIGIDNNLRMWYFIFIFIIALFNRESAIYIPLWMIISAFPKDKKKIGYSLIMLLIGVGLTYYLRLILFKSSFRNNIGLNEADKLLGNHIYLFENLYYLFVKPFLINLEDSHYIFIPAVVLASYLFCVRLWREKHIRDVLIYSGIIILASFAFGYISETRIWLPVIPAVLYMLNDTLWNEKIIESVHSTTQ